MARSAASIQNEKVAEMITARNQTQRNIRKSKEARQLKEFTETELQNSADEKELIGMKNEALASSAKAGLGSDSFFNMAYDNITMKEKYSTALDTATNEDLRKRSSYWYETYLKRNEAVESYTAYYDDWKQTYSQEVLANPRNSPGGVYTGLPNGVEGGKFNKLSKSVNKNYVLKNALLGTAMKPDGSGLRDPVEFYQKDDGVIMGKLKGFEDFDIMQTISTPPVIVQDFNKTLGKRFETDGYKNQFGQIKKEFLNEKEMVETRGWTKGDNPVEVITRTYPVKAAASQRWLDTATQVLEGQIKSINNQEDFDNMQATYMSIAGSKDVNNDGFISGDEFGKDMKGHASIEVKPLEWDGQYNMTLESQDRLRAVFLDNAYKEFMGPGTVQEYEVVDKPKFNKQSGGSGSGGDTKAPTMLDNIVEISDETPENQANTVNSQFNPKDQKVTYNPDTKMMEEIVYVEQTDGDGNSKKVEEKTQYYLGEGDPDQSTVSNDRNIKLGTKDQWETRIFDLFWKGDSKAKQSDRLKFIKNRKKQVNSGTTAAAKIKFFGSQ